MTIKHERRVFLLIRIMIAYRDACCKAPRVASRLVFCSFDECTYKVSILCPRLRSCSSPILRCSAIQILSVFLVLFFWFGVFPFPIAKQLSLPLVEFRNAMPNLSNDHLVANQIILRNKRRQSINQVLLIAANFQLRCRSDRLVQVLDESLELGD